MADLRAAVPRPRTPSQPHLLRRAESCMGTVFSFAINVPEGGSDEAANEAVDAAVACLREADAAWSPFLFDSLVSRLRRNETAADPSGALGLEEVLERCETAWLVTRGAFDPWDLPGGFDPSGIVKGWAIERAVAVLVAAGFPDVALGGGGDVAFRGSSPGSAGWRVGLRDPADPGRIYARAAVLDAAVASSGIYERGRHIVDPRTGRTGGNLVGVSVFGPDLGWADAFATALLADDDPAPAWWANLPQYRCLAVFADGTLDGDVLPDVEVLSPL